MTIKEIEKLLEVPRATIRFYEKEGLLTPHREENGYRDYSEQDVEQLKKIIIFRKLGITVDDIEDLLDGARSVDSVLEDNMKSLEKQIEELTGALNLCRKMKNDSADIETFDTDGYWNYVGEEEKNGHPFADIAKDIVKTEKNVILSYLGWTDSEGNLYDPKKSIFYALISYAAIGVVLCFYKGEWKTECFVEAFAGIAFVILAELIFSIPLYFLEKRFPWIAKNRAGALAILIAMICVILLVLAFVFGQK